MDPLFASLRAIATVPDLPEPTPEELAARAADLARRIDADIAAPMPPKLTTCEYVFREERCRTCGRFAQKGFVTADGSFACSEGCGLSGVIRFPRCMLDAAGGWRRWTAPRESDMAETIPPPTDADRELALQPLYLLSVNGTGVDVPIRGALIRLLAEERRLREQAEADVERLSLKVNDLRQQLDARRKSEADAVAENERMRAELAEAVEALVPFAAECDKRSWLADHEPAMRLFGIGGNAINNGHIMDAAAFVAKHKGNA